MDSATLTLVLTLAVASIVMVPAMVQFTTAAIAIPARPAAFKVWGLIYLAAWSAIGFVMFQFAMLSNATLPQAVALLTLGVGGWATFQASWLWLWLSLELSNLRAGNDTATLPPAREKLCRRSGQLAVVGLIAVALAAIELGYVRKLVETMIAPGHRAIAATILVTAIGAFLLLFGGMRMVLRRGEPMTHAEIEEDIGRVKLGLQSRSGDLRFGGVKYRHFGPAKGASAQQELSITEMTKAWRSGEWRRNPNLFNAFIMTAGGLMMIYGGFGIPIAAGPLWTKVLCGGLLAFVTFKLIAALRRA